MKRVIAGLLAGTLLAAGSVHAASIASVSLSGFIQNGTVSNNAASAANITSIIYGLGPAGDGIATWDTENAGGTTSDHLSNPQYFQTVTWGGLAIAPGADFSFSGLDIDLIQTLIPLSVTGAVLDDVGTSVVGAFVTVNWSDGTSGTTPLAQQAWSVDQSFRIVSDGAVVPEPGALGLLGLGALMMVVAARRRRAA